MTNDFFRESIEVRFGDLDISDKEVLGVLMRKRGYFNAKDQEQRVYQSQVLLDDAWDTMKALDKRGTYRKEEGVRVATKVYKEHIVIRPHGFRKIQYRNPETGRIETWE